MDNAEATRAERMMQTAIDMVRMKQLLPNYGNELTQVMRTWDKTIIVLNAVAEFYAKSEPQDRRMIFLFLRNFVRWIHRNADHLDFVGERR